MIFTPNQIESLLELIEYHHVLFIAKNVGVDVLSSADKSLLKRFGVKLDDFLDETNLLHQSYKFGVLSMALGDDITRKMTYPDFERYLRKGEYIPLTLSEKNALWIVKNRAYSEIKGLGNLAGQDLREATIKASQEQQIKFQSEIRTSAEKAIINRQSTKDMVLDLGHKTGDWARDFGRISDHVMHSAYEEGRAQKLESEFGDEEVYVYKDVYPGACKDCIRLYLTNGLGSQPIIFKLSELRANGTNIGRKRNEWLATLDGIHPWCRCTINYISKGSVWNDKIKRFEEGDYVRKVQRRSKIKVTINGKVYEA